MISLCQIGLLALGTWIGARLAFAHVAPLPARPPGRRRDRQRLIGILIGLPALRLSAGSISR